MVWFRSVLVALALAGRFAAAEPPVLSPEELAALDNLLQARSPENERSYFELSHRQLLRDLHRILTSPRADVTLASFTDDEEGADRGYGLHEVRRLEGEGRDVTVNIHWPFRPKVGGFTFPDEVRIRSRIGEHVVDGRYRVLWDQFDKASLVFEPVAAPEGGSLQRRVQVSVFSCRGCHDSDRKKYREKAAPFLAEGEKLNTETIVQSGRFKQDLSQSRGYLQVQEYLRKNAAELKISEKRAEAILGSISQRKDLDLPQLTQGVKNMIDQRISISLGAGGDSSVVQPYPVRVSGLYERDGVLYLDSLHGMAEGRYDPNGAGWWGDKPALPRSTIYPSN